MGNHHILLVDDDMISSHALKQYLEARHFVVSLADDCKQARKMLGGPVKVDLMILDYLMPDENGVALLQDIAQQETLQTPPVIMCSSIISNHDSGWKALYHRLHPVAQSLIHAFVSKPFSYRMLDLALRRTLKVKIRKTDPPELLSGDYIAPPSQRPPDQEAA